MTYDVVTVGGGIGGAALALSLARDGRRVLVLERTREFRDRVRGEGLLPWGVNVARDLGIYELLVEGCGRSVRYWTSHSWKQRPPRDLARTAPRGAPCLAFYHPRMQAVLLDAAAKAGAEVRRGAAVSGIAPGARPSVRVGAETIPARLVVGADGRGSKVRDWLGLEPRRDPDRLVVAGVLLEGVAAPDDSIHVFRDSREGRGALFFPLGDGLVRTYFIYRKRGRRMGLTGTARVPALIDACTGIGVPREWLARAAPAGPLAEFDGRDTWTEQPYRDGVALIGDAAASNDPSWGNGLSLALRDVAGLSAALRSHADPAQAGCIYAAEHDRAYGVIRRVTRWLASLLYEIGPEADARRARAFPLMEKDRRRSLDYIALGPDTPSDEEARRRFFGEDREAVIE